MLGLAKQIAANLIFAGVAGGEDKLEFSGVW